MGGGVRTENLGLGVDVGGSGIKGAIVDLGSGEFHTERVKIATPVSYTHLTLPTICSV